MAIKREPDLWCDLAGPNCVGWLEYDSADRNPRSLRAAAKRRGWTYEPRDDTGKRRDGCPPCSRALDAPS